MLHLKSMNIQMCARLACAMEDWASNRGSFANEWTFVYMTKTEKNFKRVKMHKKCDSSIWGLLGP